MSMNIEMISNSDEIINFMPVIESAWNSNNALHAFKDTIHSMAYHGGFVLAAYDGGELVGMSFSYPGYRNGKVYLYSHMTGVISEKKTSGIGYLLKMKQKEYAQSYGYNLIAWTFDPMMSTNAHFNLNKLGAFSRSYLDNFYGNMGDGLNSGLPTDRLVAEWYINDIYDKNYQDPVYINELNYENYSLTFNDFNDEEIIGMKMFTDFQKIKKNDLQTALKIKLKYRDIFKKLLNNNYTIINFEKKNNAYIFRKNYELKQKNIFK